MAWKAWFERHAVDLAVCTAVTLFQLAVEWSFDGLAEFDAYYHVGLAELYAHEGLVRSFPWMSAAVITEHFADPQLLIHLLMLPSIWLGVDSTVVGKLVAAMTAAGAGCTLYWALRRLGVRAAPIFTLLALVASPYALARLTFIKSTALFLILVLVLFVGLHERRRMWLFAVAWIGVYTYQGFPLLLLIAGLYVGVAALLDTETAPPYPLLIPIVLGFAAGLLLNPFFPNDLYLLNFELVEQVLLRPKDVILGGEWGSVEGNRFIFASSAAFALAFVGEQAMAVTRAAVTPLIVSLRVTGALLLLGAMMSTRLLDYFVPFAVFGAALSVEAALRAKPTEAQRRALTLAFLLIGVPGALFSTKEGLRIAKGVAKQIGAEDFRRVAKFVESNSTAGELVVSDWDDFPMLFRYNRHNVYLYGLSPTYGHGKDPQFFAAHKLLYDGRVGDPEIFLKALPTRWILVARSNEMAGRRQLLETLKKSPAFRLAFSSGDVYLFELKP